METNVLAPGLREEQKPTPFAAAMRSARESYAANAFSSAAFVVAQAGANLWLTRFLIMALGLAAYGMVPLVGSLVAYTTIFTAALNSALSRFLVLDLEAGDSRAANRTFNTSLFALLALAGAATPLVLIFTGAFPALFDVPAGQARDARWLFALAAAASFGTVIAGCFQVSPFIYSQFVLVNLVNFVGLACRLGVILALFALLPARLWYVGGGAAVAALVALAGFVVLWRQFTPELHIRRASFDPARLLALAGMGGWTTVNTLGAVLFTRTDLVVVNAFFGAVVTGGYGTVVQFPLLMESLVGAAATPIRPAILIKYAQQDFVGLQQLATRSVRLLGLLLALPAGLLCGFARPFLGVWLGAPFDYVAILLVLLVCHLGVNLSVRPLLWVQTAYNKIRWPGVATLVSGAASVGLAILLARWGRWGAAGVPLGFAIGWSLKNVVYMPVYTAHIMGLRWWTYLPSLAPAAIGTFAAASLAYGLTLLRPPATWGELAVAAAAVSALYGAGVWVAGLTPADRSLLGALLPARLH
jgi:membrane protein EpsK